MKKKKTFSLLKKIFFHKNVLIGKKRILAFFLIFAVSVGIISEVRYRAYAQTTYTLAQVQAHNSPNNPPGCWIIVKDTADNKFKVYNITSYFSIHPGGASTMAPSCGASDATNAFKNTPHSHSTAAWNLLRNTYYIGDLAAADTQKPTISIAFPTANQVFTDTTVTVTGTATDNVGLAKAEAKIGNGPWVAQTISGKSAGYSISVSPLVVGNNTISVRSTDTSGRVSTVVTRAVSYNSAVDTVPPTVTINSPALPIVNPSITLSGTAADNVGLAKVNIKVGSAPVQTKTLTGKTANWSIAITLSSGANNITATAYDTSNLPSAVPASINVTYTPPASDAEKPVVIVSSPLADTSFSSPNVNVVIKATDNAALSKIEVQVGSGTPQVKIVNGKSANWTAPVILLSTGTNTIKIKAYDTSLNVSSVVSLPVIYAPVGTSGPSPSSGPNSSSGPAGRGEGWGVPTQPVGLTNDFSGIVMNITNWVLGFIALIAVMMIIWGGVQYLIAAGDESATEGAKKTIMYGVIGLVIVGLSYAIVVVVVNTIIGGAFS